jgi:microcystin-dependent protein
VANTIRPKRSYTAASVPAASIAGELSINAADGKIWITDAAATSQILVSSLSRSDHTGTLAVTSGGTGATSANAAANAILPSQASNSGKYLTTNGTDSSWGTVSSGSTLPTGALMPYAGATAPTGYLLCDGSSISSSTYLALHAVLSNTYGGSAYTGAGALSFNLPDLRGRLPMGAGTGTGQNASGTGAPSGTAQTARTRGQWLGEETHQLTTANMPSHSHNGATANAGSHTHTLNKEVLTYVGSGGNRYDPYPGSVWAGSPAAGLTLSTQADHSHTIPSNGSDGRHATIPPCVVLNYIIKT